MRELRKLAESEIVAAVETRYGVSTAALSFLPLGNDSATAVYRLDARNGATYFVKVRSGGEFSISSLAIPQFLHAQGVPHILAPLATLYQTSWVEVNDLALTLYPFIEQGRTAARTGLTDSQWREFGALVRRIHTGRLTPALLEHLPRERFIPKKRELIPVLEAAMGRTRLANDAQRELAEYWRSHQTLIQELVSRADSLGAQLRNAFPPTVVCHADMHTFNVLLDRSSEFWLVDWDEVILALPERDLMFVMGGIATELVNPHQTTLFLQGYGGPPADPRALTYYRYAWAVQDLAAYGESVFLLPDLSEQARSQAVAGLRNLFGPGEIIEIALASGA